MSDRRNTPQTRVEATSKPHDLPTVPRNRAQSADWDTVASSDYSSSDPRFVAVTLVKKWRDTAPERFKKLRSQVPKVPGWSEAEREKVAQFLEQLRKSHQEASLMGLLAGAITVDKSWLREAWHAQGENRSRLIQSAMKSLQRSAEAFRELARLDNEIGVLTQLADGSSAAEPPLARAKWNLSRAKQYEADIHFLRGQYRAARSTFSMRRLGVKQSRDNERSWGQYGNLECIHQLQLCFALPLPLLGLLLELAYYAWTDKEKLFDPGSLGKALRRFKNRLQLV